MPDSLLEIVRAAIVRNVDARQQYNEAMYEMSEKAGYSKPEERDPNEVQVLYPPATEDEISELEELVGKQLPPSYRCFLQIHNGWKMIDGSPDFFSVMEVLKYNSSKAFEELKNNALERGDEYVLDCVVIGAQENGPDVYLLNPHKVSGSGEWELIEYEKADQERYKDFLTFLRVTEKEYRESISDLDEIEYFDPFT